MRFSLERTFGSFQTSPGATPISRRMTLSLVLELPRISMLAM